MSIEIKANYYTKLLIELLVEDKGNFGNGRLYHLAAAEA